MTPNKTTCKNQGGITGPGASKKAVVGHPGASYIKKLEARVQHLEKAGDDFAIYVTCLENILKKIIYGTWFYKRGGMPK